MPVTSFPGSPVDGGPPANARAGRIPAGGLRPVHVSRPAVGVGALLGGKIHLARLWPGRGGQELTAHGAERGLRESQTPEPAGSWGTVTVTGQMPEYNSQRIIWG